MERFLNSIKQFFEQIPDQRAKLAQIRPHIKILNLNNSHWVLKFTGSLLLLGGLIILAGITADAKSKFLPKTTIENIAIGGLTHQEAIQRLENEQLTPPAHLIELSAQETTIASAAAELGAYYDYEATLTGLLEQQQEKLLPWLKNLLLDQQQATATQLPIIYDQQKLIEMVGFLKQNFDQQPVQPSALLGVGGVLNSLAIDLGRDAWILDQDSTLAEISGKLTNITAEKISYLDTETLQVTAKLEQVSHQLTEEEVATVRERAAGLVGETLRFEKDHLYRELDDTDLVSLLSLPAGYNESAVYGVLETWAENLNRQPQNAEFVYDPDTLAVETFVPPRNGLTLEIEPLRQDILEGLYELEHTDTENLTEATITKELKLTEAQPEIPLSATNDLGINERIGFGESYYYHSIPNRIHNVSLTTSKLNLHIVAPGEEFSFNKAIGDVSSATGFRSAYVIKDGATILGDGGGVCQVSTTLFRSLLDSGLKVTRRLQHSYRVSYYELDQQPGFDATVYSGDVDLRFVNDTDQHVLIYAEADPSILYMTVELYGTSDGRTTEITDYETWGYRPALPPEYAPDPSLAPGQLRQIDWAASGIKAQFTHTVRDKDGEVISEKTYYSNYRPWAAKYLQGV